MTETEILAIPIGEPSRLFTGDFEIAKTEHRKLRAKWHPDRGGKVEVFKHIDKLYEEAQMQLSKGAWVTPGLVVVQNEKDSSLRYEIRFLRKHDTEVGETYVGAQFVSYAFRLDCDDLATAFVKNIKALKFPTEKVLAAESRSYVPTIESVFSSNDRKWVVVRKDVKLLCLRDVLNHFNGKVHDKHVAWIVSRMLALACYVGLVAKLQHADISPDTVFIDPAAHRASLLGGWGFATPLGHRIRALPSRSIAAGLGPGIATPATTGALIRLTALDLLGGKGTGSNLLIDKSIPPPMLRFLRAPSSEHPLEDFDLWLAALNASYGARKFFELALTAQQVYKEAVR